MKSIAAAGAALAFVWAASASAQHVSDAEPITIGEALTVMTHDADRKLNVVLPRGYEQAEERFPLVLVLEGRTFSSPWVSSAGTSSGDGVSRQS